MTIEIALPTEFTQEHAAALGQYFHGETTLNRTQWELVWDGVVILKPAFWATLDGETRPSQLEEVLDILPNIAEIRAGTHELVVVEYQEWKERVKTRQEGGE